LPANADFTTSSGLASIEHAIAVSTASLPISSGSFGYEGRVLLEGSTFVLQEGAYALPCQATGVEFVIIVSAAGAQPTPTPTPEPTPPRATQTAPRARKPKGAKPIRKQTTRSDGRTENAIAVESIFNEKQSITPFENQTQELKWVKLTISDAVPLPDNRPLLLEEPFVRAAYANYAHLILGQTADKTEYIIGVPGEYSPDLRPQAKRLGFSQFKTNARETPKRGDDGYWLMFIDM
jgi:hypothetical protein